ncbi:MAG: response regulator [Candidatus Bipolaricaulis sp.]|jgi:DNA-binding response OmpR family regulator|nr:response regulator [Candidatus Bipolaricaulis sp.]
MAKKILIVEDDKFLRELIVKKISNEGYDVLEAVDGEQGLSQIKEGHPDLVLLDLILPGIDGFEVLAQKREDPFMASVPVIILSNLGQKEDVDKGLSLGAADYLIKAHFTPGEIIEKVRNHLK